MSKASVASHLRAMNGQAVIMRVTGVRTVEDMDAMREDIKRLLRENNIPEDRLSEDDVKFFIEGGLNFWMKPKLKREQKGTLKVRSKDYMFIPDGEDESHALYGNKKGLTYAPDQIKVEKTLSDNPRAGGLISYELA